MNGMNTILCTIRQHLGKSLDLSFSFLIITILAGCTSTEKQERPSPLTSDSIQIAGNLVSIEYSSPSVRNRQIWGKLDPYNKVWRIGANDATIFYTEKDIILMDTILLTQGKYSLFAIPREGDWTIIFNKKWEQWGSFYYDKSFDKVRFDITPEFGDEFKEQLTFDLTNKSLNFHWEYLQFQIPFAVR